MPSPNRILGTRLRNGWKVVIAGRLNVGKSRLSHAIAGYERSIVHPRPGDADSFRPGHRIALVQARSHLDAGDRVGFL